MLARASPAARLIFQTGSRKIQMTSPLFVQTFALLDSNLLAQLVPPPSVLPTVRSAHRPSIPLCPRSACKLGSAPARRRRSRSPSSSSSSGQVCNTPLPMLLPPQPNLSSGFSHMFKFLSRQGADHDELKGE